MRPSSLSTCIASVQELPSVQMQGVVRSVTGGVIRGTLPGARIGDWGRVVLPDEAPLTVEAAGFVGDELIFVPIGETTGVGPDMPIHAGGRTMDVLCGPGLLGRVLNGLGLPIDGRPLGSGPWEHWPISRPAPAPMGRQRIQRVIPVGIRAVDGLVALGEGQRVGVFAGAGVGKSSLLGQVARNADADVCVVCLIGERGREVREFVEDALGDGLSRSVVICATSDETPLLRVKAAQVATAVAEYFRDQDKRVLLLVDSVTRYARALREVALAAGEHPARRGFPGSVFTQIPRLLERAGPGEVGSITALYTVLVEGDDLEDPIADEVRGTLDGHWVLSRKLAERGHWPAVDVLASVSRVMERIVSTEHIAAAQRLRQWLAAYEARRDAISLGVYQPGSDRLTDQALARIDAVLAFLGQSGKENVSWERMQNELFQACEEHSSETSIDE